MRKFAPSASDRLYRPLSNTPTISRYTVGRTVGCVERFGHARQGALYRLLDSCSLDCDGGHNGLKDIAEVLGSTKYSRLRVGIGKDFCRGQQIDHVLGKWNAKEKDELIEIIPRACETAKSFAAIGLKFTMEKYNQK